VRLTGTDFHESKETMSVGGAAVAETKALAARRANRPPDNIAIGRISTGLRAIAIRARRPLSRRFFRAESGFVGVDVFFVISGYLMASLLLDAMERSTFRSSNSTSAGFAASFPALFVTIASSAVAAWAF